MPAERPRFLPLCSGTPQEVLQALRGALGPRVGLRVQGFRMFRGLQGLGLWVWVREYWVDRRGLGFRVVLRVLGLRALRVQGFRGVRVSGFGFEGVRLA